MISTKTVSEFKSVIKIAVVVVGLEAEVSFYNDIEECANILGITQQ